MCIIVHVYIVHIHVYYNTCTFIHSTCIIIIVQVHVHVYYSTCIL